VFVAFEDQPYRLYRGPGWLIHGTKTIKPPVLNPGGSIEKTASVLHNRALQRITQRDIDTAIALPKPGRYRLKATLFENIESAPIEIFVGEPRSEDDREIWKIMSKRLIHTVGISLIFPLSVKRSA